MDDRHDAMQDDDDDDDVVAQRQRSPISPSVITVIAEPPFNAITTNGKRASGKSLTTEMDTSIPRISVTAESNSTTDATPSLVNGRGATASESLSSLSEIDTVDSEAETERIDEFEDDAATSIHIAAPVLVSSTSEDERLDESRKSSPPRGRNRRRPEAEDDGDEMMVDEEDGVPEGEEEEEVDVGKRDEQSDEEPPMARAEETEEKQPDQDDEPPEPEEPEQEES